MLGGGWFELPVGPEMILRPSKHEDAGKRDRFIYIGIPVSWKQVHGGVPYVLTPRLAPLGGFDHDAAANVAFAALRRRFTQDREREARGARRRRRLLHLASWLRLLTLKPYAVQRQSFDWKDGQLAPLA